MRNIVATASIALLCLWPLITLSAQPEGFYYQSIMPDGSVVVGDKPAPGAKEVKKLPLVKGNSSAPLATQQQQQQQQQAASTKAVAQDNADQQVAQAQRRLDEAKNALASGQEPRPGERIGTAGGASRLTEAYEQRIKGLEDAVAQAQKQLDDAYARRNTTK